MRASTCLLLFCCLCFTARSQNLSGKWTGYLHKQAPNEADYEVTINLQYTYNKQQLVGIARYTKADHTYFVDRVEGIQNKDRLIITETEVKETNTPNAVWCLKKIQLVFQRNDKLKRDSLTGLWSGVRVYDNRVYFEIGVAGNGNAHNCEPGMAFLIHGDKPPRENPFKPKVIETSLSAQTNLITPVIPHYVAPVAVKVPKQKKDIRPRDGYYDKTQVNQKHPVKYAALREADVSFAKRIWRQIDVREKMNRYLASPKARLIDLLVEGIKNDSLTAYSPDPQKDDPGGDSFAHPLTQQEALARLTDSTTVNKLDSLGNIIKAERVAGEFNPDSIVTFRLKEDWVFDRQRSVYEPRIIGIAPLIVPKAAPGVELDAQPAFWIYFPQARPLLASKPVANEHNDATGLSFDDVFLKRLFTSYIVKQSNDRDERIKDYAHGVDALYESQRITKAMMDWELDLWQN